MSAKITIPKIILASASPRRKMLLEQIGIPFDIIIPNITESIPSGNDFATITMENAKAKALSVVNRASEYAILSADTLVELEGTPLGKPQNYEEALKMLQALSGRKHTVYTGYVLLDLKSNLYYKDYEATDVWFKNLSIREIEDYIASGEPFDKAGAYGIQARGALFIKRINGCFFNVMGLPIGKVWDTIKRWMSDCGLYSY